MLAVWDRIMVKLRIYSHRFILCAEMKTISHEKWSPLGRGYNINVHVNHHKDSALQKANQILFSILCLVLIYNMNISNKRIPKKFN